LSQLEIAKLDVFVQNGIFGFGFGRSRHCVRFGR